MEIPAINALYKTTPQEQGVNPEGTGDFPTVLAAAMNLVQETNALQNKANAEQVKFSLGETENVHDLMIASREASIALQYTNAIRSQLIQGYQTIMNMQI